MKAAIKFYTKLVVISFFAACAVGILCSGIFQLSPEIEYITVKEFFVHNSMYLLLMALGTVLTNGVLGYVLVVYNGVSLGIYIGALIKKYEVLAFFRAVLPHGFFEMTAMLIWVVCPYHIFKILWNRYIRKNSHESQMKDIRKYMLLLIVGIIFCGVAALLEERVSEANFLKYYAYKE